MVDADYCVVGAGFAGLTAALRLTQAGHSVRLLEARDRVGGRTYTETRDGYWIDRGGAWIGPGQDRIYALMQEFGIPSYQQYVSGDAMMFVGGKKYRYGGDSRRFAGLGRTIPLSMSPFAVANIGTAFLQLSRMCKSVPPEFPWAAPKAKKWDQMTWARWLDGNTVSKPARELLEHAVCGLYTSAAAELSLLFVLYQMAAAGGPAFVLGVQDGAEDARPVGGMGAIHRALVAELGDALTLSQPVRGIVQDEDGVTVRSDGMTVRARRVIVTVPICIAAHIDYQPALPPDRAFLHQRMPSGAVVKIALVYDEPFWRSAGLSGQSFAPESAANLTIDSCTPTGDPGILTVITESRDALRLCALSDTDRRHAVLAAVAERLGDRALTPVDYLEQNWTVERFSGGGMIAHTPPGVLTEYGPALRAPCGRIHWAGTESADLMYGFIDGAVRSGERAAAEVIRAEAQVPA